MVGGNGGGCPCLYDGTFQACPTDTCYPTTAVRCMSPRIRILVRSAYETTIRVTVKGVLGPMHPLSSELKVKGIDPTTTSVVTYSEGFG